MLSDVFLKIIFHFPLFAKLHPEYYQTHSSATNGSVSFSADCTPGAIVRISLMSIFASDEIIANKVIACTKVITIIHNWNEHYGIVLAAMSKIIWFHLNLHEMLIKQKPTRPAVKRRWSVWMAWPSNRRHSHPSLGWECCRGAYQKQPSFSFSAFFGASKLFASFHNGSIVFASLQEHRLEITIIITFYGWNFPSYFCDSLLTSVTIVCIRDMLCGGCRSAEEIPEMAWELIRVTRMGAAKRL